MQKLCRVCFSPRGESTADHLRVHKARHESCVSGCQALFSKPAESGELMKASLRQQFAWVQRTTSVSGSENLKIWNQILQRLCTMVFLSTFGITGATPSRILGPALRGGGGAALEHPSLRMLEQNISIFNDHQPCKPPSQVPRAGGRPALMASCLDLSNSSA